MSERREGTSKASNVTLLEHLASHGWFVQQGEVALTSGLTFCLSKDQAAADAFVDLARFRAGSPADVRPRPDWWQAEWIDVNGQRPDIVGWNDERGTRAPVIVVEAKISAGFAARQISLYAERQQQLLHNAGWATGVLVVLVPDDRIEAAADEVGVDLCRLGVRSGPPWVVPGAASVSVVVVSWSDALNAMCSVDGPAAEDIRQLAGAARVLRAPYIAAFDEEDLVEGWHDRFDDLRAVIDRVTREATIELQTRGLGVAHLPWQPNPSEGLAGGFRYIGEPDQPNIAVGIATPGLHIGDGTPLWVRWHRATTDAEKVQGRLRAHDIDSIRDASGLIWMPLHLEADVGLADRQVRQLVRQVVEAYLAGRRTTEGIPMPSSGQ